MERLNRDQRLALLGWVGKGMDSAEVSRRAAEFSPPFRVTKSQVSYYRTSRGKTLKEIQEKDEDDALTSGLASKKERIRSLSRLAGRIEMNLMEADGLYITKQVSGGQEADGSVQQEVRFNSAEVREFRMLLRDIDRLVGEKVEEEREEPRCWEDGTIIGMTLTPFLRNFVVRPDNIAKSLNMPESEVAEMIDNQRRARALGSKEDFSCLTGQNVPLEGPPMNILFKSGPDGPIPGSEYKAPPRKEPKVWQGLPELKREEVIAELRREGAVCREGSAEAESAAARVEQEDAAQEESPAAVETAEAESVLAAAAVEEVVRESQESCDARTKANSQKLYDVLYGEEARKRSTYDPATSRFAPRPQVDAHPNWTRGTG